LKKIKINDTSFAHSSMFVNASETPFFKIPKNYVPMCLN